MKISRLNWLSLLLVLVMLAIAAWFYPALPDPVPTHFNAAGEADGWTAKPWGAYLMPLMSLGLLGLLLVLPAISPRGFRLDSARRVYDIVVFSVIAFMLMLELFTFRAAMGSGSDLSRAMPAMIGLLFVVLGNYLGKFPKNFFVGIRTPWTLASDEVWNRTHRLGGWVFMLAGIVMIISGLAGWPIGAMVTAIVAAALVPAVYSLLLYRKLHGFDAGEG